MAGTLTSNQLNYLVWRYLQESGFRDSSLALGKDCNLEGITDHNTVQVGALIDLVQCGLMYKECEALIQGNNTTGFTVVTELLPRKPALQYSDEDCIKEPTNRGGYFPTPGLENPPKQQVTSQGHGQAEFAEGMSLKEDGDVEMGGVPSTRKHGREEVTNGVGKDGTVQPKKKRKTKQPIGTAKSPPPTATPKTMATPEVEMAIGEEEVSTPMEEMRITNGESVGTQLDIIEIPPSARSTISSHTKIYHCAWNPCYGTLLATGGPGVPVQVWRMGSGELQTIITATYPNGTRTGAINSLEWKSDGSGIATGRQDGLITLWTPSGDAKFNVGEKCGAIIYFRWNPTKTMFVTLHLQNILNVWDAMTGERILTQEADYVNVVWTGKESVACSSDTGDITIATVSTEGFKPQTILRHHTSEVAHLSWDEETDRLASAEASKIAIWKGNSSKAPDWSFDTTGDVTALAWQPLKREAPLLNGAVNGTASNVPGGKSRLLAASLNGVGIFIWDVVSHTCLQQLHIGNRYPQSFAFSPGGRFIAAGLDRTTFIWDVEDGILKAAHDGRLQRENEPITNGNGISGMDDSAVEVYETQVVLKWNCSGDRIATLWGTECEVLTLPEPVTDSQ